MKSKRLAKLIALAVTALLLIGAAIGFSVSAEETTAEIGYINVAYEGQLRIVYDVKNVTLAEGEKLAVLVWEDGESVEDAKVIDTCEPCRSDAYSRFYSDGFAPKDLRKPVSAAAAILDADGALVKMGKTVATYSVYDYVMGRFAYGNNTPDQQALYIALLDYGAAVQEVLYDSYISQGATEEEATAEAGLTYGYADEYYAYVLTKLTNVNGQVVKNSSDISFYRPHESRITLEAPAIFMGKVFAGYTDVNGESVKSDEYATDYMRVYENYQLEPGINAITANYMRPNGIVPSWSTSINDFGVSYTKDNNTSVSFTDAPGGGIIFDKTTTKRNPTLKKNPDLSGNNATNGYIVGEMDITINEFYSNYNSPAYIALSAGEYGYRINLKTTTINGKVYLRFETSQENCYVPYIYIKGDFEDDGTAQDGENIIALSDKKGTRYSNLALQYYNDEFASYYIAATELEHLRIEIHPENEKIIDYKYTVVVDGDGDLATNDDQKLYNRTTTTLAPEVRLYINHEYVGSTYHGGYWSADVALDGGFKYTIFEDATKDSFSTPYESARAANKALVLSTMAYAYMGEGILKSTLNNLHYGIWNVDTYYYNDVDLNGNRLDYTNSNYYTNSRNASTATAQKDLYYKSGADGELGTLSTSNSAGATKYTITYQNQGTAKLVEDEFGFKYPVFDKTIKIISIVDGSGNPVEQMPAYNDTKLGEQVGYKAGDILRRDINGSNVFGGNSTQATLKVTENKEWDKDYSLSVFETDITLTFSGEVNNDQLEVHAKNASGGNVVSFMFTYDLDSNRVKLANYSGGGNAVYFENGATLNMRIEHYTDMNVGVGGYTHRTDLYINGQFVNSRYIGSSNSVDCNQSLVRLDLFAPSYGRSVTVALNNTYFVSYREKDPVVLNEDKSFEFDYSSDSVISSVASQPTLLTKTSINDETYGDTLKLDWNFTAASNKSQEAHLYWKHESGALPYEDAIVVFETKMKYNNLVFDSESPGGNSGVSTDAGNKYYNGWLTNLSLTDTMKTGDDVVTPVTISWNSKEKTLKATGCSNSTGIAINMNEWFSVRIVYRIGDGKLVASAYINDTYLGTAQYDMAKIANANDVYEGMRLKNKSVSYIIGGEMYFADTNIYVYDVD